MQNSDQKKTTDRILVEPRRLRIYKDQEARFKQLKHEMIVKQTATDLKVPEDAELYRELIDEGLEAKGYPMEKEVAGE
jgi:hypothetical protein